jgi:hypothetical protein
VNDKEKQEKIAAVLNELGYAREADLDEVMLDLANHKLNMIALSKAEKTPLGVGPINLQLGGSASSTKCVEFYSAQEMNDWFEKNGTGLICMAMFPFSRYDHPNNDLTAHQQMISGIMCVVADDMGGEENAQKREDLLEYQGGWERFRREKEALRAARKVTEAEAAAKLKKETEELAAVGRTCKEHHGKLAETLHDLKKEINNLKKQRRNAK